ncbi:unnamed protein product [Caenorhabditis bovis]|uniref:Uncharacterized protein n=1 Tax=Caenorhabditis bovis TaxID=2654633 RepID=A0A8S1EYW3_9PELO|nr:unnamed protein product [Caenorhabditis bovis]
MEKERSGAASIFDHWSAILELSKHSDGKGKVKSVHDRVRQIERIAADHGGEERFVSGLHANYLVSLPIGQIRKASTWFLFYDDVQKIIRSFQNWAVQKYAFAFFVSLHLTLATHSKIHIQYPQIDQTQSQKCHESEETLNTVRSGGVMSKGAHKRDLLLDILPYLVGIVQPPIKPMNDQLYTQREQAMLGAAVNAMCDYGLTYAPLMVKDQMNWLFSPPIDSLTMFPISENVTRRPLANATRQLIAHKITLRKVHLTDVSTPPRVITNTAKIIEMLPKAGEASNRKRLSAGALKRQRHQKLADVIFEHQEGDSSAIKKKVTMHQLSSMIFGDV